VGTEIGSPAQGYPKWRSLAMIDWDGNGFGATLTGRYMSKLKEVNAAGTPTMKSIFYTDAQLRWNPSFWMLNNLALAVGVNNLFNVHTPGCVSCDINNLDQTLYNTPGRFYYARVGVKFGGGGRSAPPPAYAPPPPPPPPAAEPAPAPEAAPPPPPPPPPPVERGERGE